MDEAVFESGSIFTCDKNDYCNCQFLTFKGYLNHVESENDYCKIKVPSMTDTDQVITWYIKDYGLPDKTDLNRSQDLSDMILTLQSPDPIALEMTLTRVSTKRTKADEALFDQLNLGSGLPEVRKVIRHSKDVHAFIGQLFDMGKNGTTIKPYQAVERMVVAENEDGSLRFSVDQWLKESQV